MKVAKAVARIATSGSASSPASTMLSPSEVSSSEYESSEYQSDSEDESPLPESRPEDPIAGAKYDTTKVVWSPRNKIPEAQQIRAALQSYSELVKGYRESWKISIAKLQEAEEKKELSSTVRKCKAVVNQNRLFMETALKTTLELGHPTIVEKYVESLLLYIPLDYAPSTCRSAFACGISLPLCYGLQLTFTLDLVNTLSQCLFSRPS
jgi:hypothetical protein